MELQREAFYIGIDLDDNWTQISYYLKDMAEPETVSTIAGGQRYRIPTALCKRQELGAWYLVDVQGEQEEYARVDMLLARALKKEQIQGEIDAEELLVAFMRKVIRLIPGLVEFAQIQAVTVHMEELNLTKVQLLTQVLERIGISGERIFVQDSMESFCHFVMHQKKELRQHEVVLFSCKEHRVSSFILTKEEKTMPRKVQIQKQELGILPQKAEERDKSFAAMAEEILKGRIVSAIYLVGEGMDGDWLKDSLHILCRNRRVFQGKNLYTKGACYESVMHMHNEEVDYVYFSENIIADNIFLQVRNGDRTFFKELAEAGTGRYELSASCQVLLEGEPIVEVWLQPPDRKEARVEQLRLTDLPQRPPKATRLCIEIMPGEGRQVLIRIIDMGFGEWYPSSGKVWEYSIDE